MSRRAALFGLCIAFASPFSASAAPIDDLKDDKLLAAAVQDVFAMGPEEVEQYISYRAACIPWVDSDFAVYACERERELYQLKYDRDRALDRIMRAQFLVQMQARSADKQAKANSPKRSELVELVSRDVKLNEHLTGAATVRYQLLFKIRQQREGQ